MDHTNQAPEAPVADGAQIREHWAMWGRFTSFARTCIILVALLTIAAISFITGVPIAGFAFLFVMIAAGIFLIFLK